MRGGARPAIDLPAGNTLLLSSQESYAQLDEAMVISAFIRTEGPHEGDPERAAWSRGKVVVRYSRDAAGRRELAFEGEGWEQARQQVASKVTWLRG
jgi:hypothetical protein